MNRTEITQAEVHKLYHFWLRHFITVACGMLVALSVSLVVVVPNLYNRFGWFAGTLLSYLFLAYLAIPLMWYFYEKYLAAKWYSGRTQTHAGIPSDPLNVGLIGYKKQVVRSLLRAGWVPADPISVRSCFKLAQSIMLKHPYQAAPISNLYLMDKKQDLAFERETGQSAAKRHHVRFWRTKHIPGRGWLWVGAASFDTNAGISHLTGQITHHIDPAVDKERNQLIKDLAKNHQLKKISMVNNPRLEHDGRNAQGDAYYTDGKLEIGIIL